MTLTYDIARCPGTANPLCQTCRRTEPGRPEWQSHVQPRVTTAGCPNHIPGRAIMDDGCKYCLLRGEAMKRQRTLNRAAEQPPTNFPIKSDER